MSWWYLGPFRQGHRRRLWGQTSGGTLQVENVGSQFLSLQQDSIEHNKFAIRHPETAG
jgi:hypothetical protein